MTRVRVSTTVDQDLLRAAREAHQGGTDSSLLEDALRALLAEYDRCATEAAYAVAYVQHPLDEPDEWGDLAAWRAAVGAS
ncbi:MAG: antitoxin MazE5 [Intrasporangium sp.]|uniref:antitoxin MazE5 n=1 Tax=Intrasporangium sp. TaxID=1925024 RepID=UPI0026485498|nr:antitoxin MazE5 [Intrasporangium sp.]MDN5795359.1 antitoxin MazE5 [Intrasporangium sp.]